MDTLNVELDNVYQDSAISVCHRGRTFYENDKQVLWHGAMSPSFHMFFLPFGALSLYLVDLSNSSFSFVQAKGLYKYHTVRKTTTVPRWIPFRSHGVRRVATVADSKPGALRQIRHIAMEICFGVPGSPRHQ